MKKIVAGIFAHVDAGKTTLSESLLYVSGTIRNQGRVDNGDTFLDTYELEKKRGITIFTKLARFDYKDTTITLVDTPGHVDFSAEMERSIRAIDYGILVISGNEGVQAHTEILWKLFKKNKKPVFIFVNKMDMHLADKDRTYNEILSKLSENAIDIKSAIQENDMERFAMCDEGLMEEYLETEEISKDSIARSIREGNIYPVFFGSALKMEGITEFLDGLNDYFQEANRGEKFGGVVYKINLDEGVRVTYIKITGGRLKVKDFIDRYEEKVDQLRIYNGGKFERVNEAYAGEIVGVVGLTKSKYGDELGSFVGKSEDMLAPVMRYTMCFSHGEDPALVYKKIKELNDELPELSIEWQEEKRVIQISVMGEIQLEIIRNIIFDRYGIDTQFSVGQIIYKETIANTVEGVGHFEPLRHYAEVQLKLEPGICGSGIEIKTDCSEDELAKNWQRLICTHIEEKVHRGVLTGSELTDVIITVTGGRAHNKHTEGGDFRQATYRAIRQGLMQAENVLLEPFYRFEIIIPMENLGRLMTDLGNMNAEFIPPENITEMVTVEGRAPYSKLAEYANTISAFSKGRGRINYKFDGYGKCADAKEVVESIGYIPENDLRNTADSVFCAHGAGYVVPWDEAAALMHVPSKLHKKNNEATNEYIPINVRRSGPREDNRDGYEKDMELKEIFERTYGSGNQDSELAARRKVYKKSTGGSKDSKPAGDKEYIYKPKKKLDEYLLVDGYNVIFAWEDLKELALVNMDGARDKLLDIMCNYQGYMGMKLMVVFDAYKVKGFRGEHQEYNNIQVVFTKEAETADAFIEKFAHDNGKKYNITVATSDGLEQIIITGQGCNLISSRELINEVDRVSKLIKEKIF